MKSSSEAYALTSATPIAFGETRTTSQSFGARNNVRERIARECRVVSRPKLSRNDVQSVLSERAFEVYEDLRELDTLTHRSVTEALFTPSLARYWLGEFVLLGMLRVTTKGHVWTFEEVR